MKPADKILVLTAYANTKDSGATAQSRQCRHCSHTCSIKLDEVSE